MASMDPGFKKENVMVLPLNGIDEKVASQKIAQVSGVKSVSAMSAASESLGERRSSIEASASNSMPRSTSPLA